MTTCSRLNGAAALLACLCAPVAAAEKVSFPADAVLAVCDLGSGQEKVERFGKVQKDGGRSYRAYPGKGTWCYVHLPCWWKQTAAAPESVVLAVTYQDTLTDGIALYGWTGIGGRYGYHYFGQLRGTGEGQWKRALIYVAKEFIRRRGDGAAGGRWVFQLNGTATASIDKIEVVRPDEALAAEALRQGRAARAAAIEAIKKRFKHVPHAEQGELGAVSDADRRRGFIPFVRNCTQDVHPAAAPTDAERKALLLQTYATPGEYEPLQVAVHALRNETVTAAVSDLTGPGTLRAGRDVTVRYVEAVATRAGGGSSASGWRVQPVWLRTNCPVPVKAGNSQAWYVTIHVPADAKSGDYAGTLTLSGSGGGSVRLPLRLKVLPFRLDKADHVARGGYISGVISRDFVENLRAHGCNATSMWPQGGLAPKLEGGKCVAHVSPQMNEYLKTLKQSGFVKMVYFGGGDNRYGNPGNVVARTRAKVGTPEFEKYYGQWWVDIRRLEKANDWPEMICCPFDEPVKTPAKVRNYLICYEAVKAVTPATKVFCVFMNRPWSARRLGRKSDIWSCNGAFATNAAEKRKLAGEGVHKLLYPYTMATARTRPGTVRWSTGFGPWKYSADGIYFWAYLWHSVDPFNDLDHGYSDWTPTARDIDGRIYDCVGWEGWREGIDDRRYVETAIRIAKQKNRKDVLAEIEQLRQSVVKAAEADHSLRTKGLDGFFMKIDNTSLLDVYRARVVALIMEMLAAG